MDMVETHETNRFGQEYDPQASASGHIPRPKQIIPYAQMYSCLVPFHYYLLVHVHS